MNDRNLQVSRIAVLGAGTMGHGVAQTCAQHGIAVSLFDVNEVQRDKALAQIRTGLQKLHEKQRLDTAAYERAQTLVTFTHDLALAVQDADIVIEAVPERMDLKRELFLQIEAHAPSHAILATNTSSLSVTEIAAPLRAPERVLGLHFFNPVPLMELLEIVRGIRTSDATLTRALDFAQSIGKTPIVVRDIAGFASSRLGVILGCEAIRMLESGVASAKDIDTAMKLGYRHPMGPLELTDLVGLDVRLAILEHLHRELGEQFRPPALLRQMVRAGKLGRKSGEGFYTYSRIEESTLRK